MRLILHGNEREISMSRCASALVSFEAGQEDVLEGDAAAGLLGVVRGRVEDLLELEALAERHDLLALGVVCRVQRERQSNLQRLACETADLRRQTDGGDRDAARSDREPLRMVQDPNRLHQRKVVGERLAHPHEHQVEAGILPADVLAHDDDLGDDLVRLEVARPVRACRSRKTSSPFRSRPARRGK